MKKYIGNCTYFNADWVIRVEENSREISKSLFLKNCDIDNCKIYRLNLTDQIKKFPNDFKFYRTKNKEIYWFSHSQVFYFFK